MKALVQRVSSASVNVGDDTVASIGEGLLVLLGVADGDRTEQAGKLAAKIACLRVFDGDDGRMDRSLLDTGGGALCVSQFTLYADTRKGLRPNFTAAAKPELAQPVYEEFCNRLAAQGVEVQRGSFGARMSVTLVNEGPVTLLLEG